MQPQVQRSWGRTPLGKDENSEVTVFEAWCVHMCTWAHVCVHMHVTCLTMRGDETRPENAKPIQPEGKGQSQSSLSQFIKFGPSSQPPALTLLWNKYVLGLFICSSAKLQLPSLQPIWQNAYFVIWRFPFLPLCQKSSVCFWIAILYYMFSSSPWFIFSSLDKWLHFL